MINKLPDVGRIQGVLLEPAATPRASKVILQYTDQKEAWHETTIPFLDAMYLLNLLKAMQDESGFQMPNDEPLSNIPH